MKKTRADAKLGLLPASRQEVICQYAATRSLDDTVAWLREDGLLVSRSTLSGFLKVHRVRARTDRIIGALILKAFEQQRRLTMVTGVLKLFMDPRAEAIASSNLSQEEKLDKLSQLA